MAEVREALLAVERPLVARVLEVTRVDQLQDLQVLALLEVLGAAPRRKQGDVRLAVDALVELGTLQVTHVQTTHLLY